MSTPDTSPRNKQPATAPGDGNAARRRLRVVSGDGVSPASTPSIVMPLAKTELSDLLAGDPVLCVRRPAATPEDAHARRAASGPDSPNTAPTADPELARVVAAWEGLPRNVREEILVMIAAVLPGDR